jgi:hypothetical protein
MKYDPKLISVIDTRCFFLLFSRNKDSTDSIELLNKNQVSTQEGK